LTRLVSIGRDRVFYTFAPELEPAAHVKPGDLVIFETQDALGGQVRSEEDTIEKIDFTRVNPATGPLYIEGAEPGDAIVVEVLSIETSSQGFVVTAPGAGVLGEYVKASRTRSCRVVDDYVEVLGFRIPAWRMIGVVGVASPERPSTGVPGRHGGNLDTKYITVGAKVYLPVFYEGGLLGIGDLHAVMGHGEVCIAACEVSGRVLVSVGVVKGFPRGDYLRVAVNICKYFLASGFPALGRVFIPSSAGLSGLHVTLEPLIRFKPLKARFHEATTSLVVMVSPNCTNL
jgi:amidase